MIGTKMQVSARFLAFRHQENPMRIFFFCLFLAIAMAYLADGA